MDERAEKLDKTEELNLLYDFYGKFLTGKQREVFELYYEENFSLAEIAERLSVSRQAVHANLKSAEKKLLSYEEKLALVEEYRTENGI